MSSFAYKLGTHGALLNLGLLKTAKEYAPGIPKKKIDSLPNVKKPQEWTLAIQEHDAERAGKHYDLRLVDPKTRKAHSWALPGAHLPEPSRSVLALRQPTHTEDYALHFGEKRPQKILKGYGKGTVRIKEKAPVDLYHAKDDAPGTRVRFNVYRGTGPEEYAIVNTPQGERLVNKTLTRKRLKDVPIGTRPKTKDKKIDDISTENTDEVMMPKYDGAHTLVYLNNPGKIPRVFSYRESKRSPSGVIEHTHKIEDMLNKRTPDKYKRTVLRAETVGVDKSTGKAIPASTLGGMLNASVPVSRKNQKDKNVKLQTMLFDVDKLKGKDLTNKPYKERYEVLKEISKDLDLPIAEIAKTPEEKKKLISAVKNKQHPFTEEGVMVRKFNAPDELTKGKIRPDHDVYVRNVFEATDSANKPKGRAGGFEYSWSPRGPIIGRIGTGFSHLLAKEMLQNPDKFKGRVAKVEAEKITPSGKLSKPAFKEWHIEKGKIQNV